MCLIQHVCKKIVYRKSFWHSRVIYFILTAKYIKHEWFYSESGEEKVDEVRGKNVLYSFGSQTARDK